MRQKASPHLIRCSVRTLVFTPLHHLLSQEVCASSPSSYFQRTPMLTTPQGVPPPPFGMPGMPPMPGMPLPPGGLPPGGRGMPMPPFPGGPGLPPLPQGMPFPPPGGLPPNFQFPPLPGGFQPPPGFPPVPGAGGPPPPPGQFGGHDQGRDGQNDRR